MESRLKQHNIIVKDKYGFFFSNNCILSNFYDAKFIIDGIEFCSTEQYFMYMKAIHFNDQDIANKILQECKPFLIKKLGRRVQNFNAEQWNKVSWRHMFDGCYAKFQQNKHLSDILELTKGLTLVEASPWDRIWGVGMRINDPKITDSKNWKGKNQLGEILTMIRIEFY